MRGSFFLIISVFRMVFRGGITGCDGLGDAVKKSPAISGRALHNNNLTFILSPGGKPLFSFRYQ